MFLQVPTKYTILGIITAVVATIAEVPFITCSRNCGWLAIYCKANPPAIPDNSGVTTPISKYYIK